MFHLTLPDVAVAHLSPSPMNDSNYDICAGHCRRFAAVKQSLNALTISTDQIMRRAFVRIKDLIPDIRGPLTDSPRKPRGFQNFIGKISKEIFGTAEDADVD